MGIFDFFKKKKIEEKDAIGSFSKAMVDRVFAEIGDKKRPVIQIEAIDQSPTLTQSKFGGLPYLPKTIEPPKGETGDYLQLLAQFNLSELPLGSFPLSQGMLQFWIADEAAYGLDFDNNISQKGSRVVYHPTLTTEFYSEVELSQWYPQLCDEKKSQPLTHCFGLKFTPEAEGISSGDYAFDGIFTNTWNQLYPQNPITGPYDLPDEVIEDPYNDHSGFGHKLLGFPAFTQTDPRDEKQFGDYRLLFQMDSVGTNTHEIMWGDSGVCGFFIKDSDLENRDFSKVLYNWDCY